MIKKEMNELTAIFELATSAKEFSDEVISKTKNIKKEKDSAKIGSSGYFAKIGSSGDYAQIGSNGYSAKIGSNGYSAKIGSSGDSAKIGSSGYSAQIGSGGDSAKIGSSGYYAQIGSSGDYAQIGSSGYYAQIGSSGYYAQIGSSGDYAEIGSSGDYAKIGSSGDSAQIESIGKHSIISAIGRLSYAKAKTGSWITLAEYKEKNGKTIIDFVKAEFVDGVNIKEDTYYCLCNHEFKEVIEIDGIKSAVVSKKGSIYKVKNFGEKKESYIIEKDGVYSHGSTVKEAKESFVYKISNRNTSQYSELTLDSVVTKEEAIKMYRVITGACEFGTKYFVNSLDKRPKEITIEEIIKITNGQYGNESFRKFFNK